MHVKHLTNAALRLCLQALAIWKICTVWALRKHALLFYCCPSSADDNELISCCCFLLCKTSDLDAFDNARVERLPESIGKLKQLRTLFIANSNISHLSTPMVALEKLYTLDLSGLQLTTLPESICRSLLIQVFVLCAQSCHCTRLTHHAPFDVVTVCFAVCANWQSWGCKAMIFGIYRSVSLTSRNYRIKVSWKSLTCSSIAPTSGSFIYWRLWFFVGCLFGSSFGLRLESSD